MNGLDFGTAIGLIKGLGSPDPAVIESAVSEWLDDHPEATTTVQDGSITKAKLDSNLQGTVDDVADLKSQLDQKQDIIYNTEDVSFTKEGGLLSSNTGTIYNPTSTTLSHTSISVNEGEKYIISCSSNNQDYAGAWYTKNGTVVSKLYTDLAAHINQKIVVPANVDTLYLNCNINLASTGIVIIKETSAVDTTSYMILRNTVEDNSKKITRSVTVSNETFTAKNKDNEALYSFDMPKDENLYRTVDLEYDDFVWGTFDKAYFAFVQDDSNENLPPIVEVFHNKGVPLSSAVIVEHLDSYYSTQKTIEEWLQDMVSDGGEVLVHYNYDLKQSTPDADWIANTVEKKKILEDRGFSPRGIIRANNSDVASKKGQFYCNRYFDYSDGLGIAKRFRLTRKFMGDWGNDIDNAKRYIDAAVASKGFFPIAFHSNNSEPLAKADKIGDVIDYILSKGSANAVITTYSAVFDAFRASRVSDIEENRVFENALAISCKNLTASQNISNGQYVINDGDMYKATDDISDGESLTGKIEKVTGGCINDLKASIPVPKGNICAFDIELTEAAQKVVLPFKNDTPLNNITIMCYLPGVENNTQCNISILVNNKDALELCCATNVLSANEVGSMRIQICYIQSDVTNNKGGVFVSETDYKVSGYSNAYMTGNLDGATKKISTQRVYNSQNLLSVSLKCSGTSVFGAGARFLGYGQ